MAVDANVTMRRVDARANEQEALWVAIRNTKIDYKSYKSFIDSVLGEPGSASVSVPRAIAEIRERSAIYGPDAYKALKAATEAYLLIESGMLTSTHSFQHMTDGDFQRESERLERTVTRDSLSRQLRTYLGANETLPYIDRIVEQALGLRRTYDQYPNTVFNENQLLKGRTRPLMIELIWSYWHEEGMLAQCMKAIALRFQNRKRRGGRDPLADLALEPLRPLSNLMWGYVQDEIHRLTVARRAYEYDHHYGLRLVGRAVPPMSPADSRTKFVGAFHGLLQRTAEFYRQDANTTVVADAFPLLNAIREVHLILAEGAHNQFGDLPWTARAEMLVEQWLLARPEMKEFLRGRYMIPYQEGWMASVDAMKRLQGWTDVSVMYFNNLAIYGEQLLLSARYDNWAEPSIHPDRAKSWARYWKPEIQGYMHAYSAVTGVDLAVPVAETRDGRARVAQPGALIRRQLQLQRTSPTPALPAPDGAGRMTPALAPPASLARLPARR
jgi:hypothetical protein